MMIVSGERYQNISNIEITSFQNYKILFYVSIGLYLTYWVQLDKRAHNHIQNEHSYVKRMSHPKSQPNFSTRTTTYQLMQSTQHAPAKLQNR